MKTRGQVAQKFKQVRWRHVKREVRRLLRRSAPNCVNNRNLDLDIGPVGVCVLDCNVCDARFEDRAEGCSEFLPSHTKEEVKASLQEFFRERTVPEIAVRFPDVAALLWVLLEEGGEDPQSGPLLPHALADTLLGVPVWFDSEAERGLLHKALGSYLADHETVSALSALLETDDSSVVAAFQGDREEWESKLEAVAEEGEAKDRKLEKLAEALAEEVSEAEALRETLSELRGRTTAMNSRPWWRSLWPF